MKCNRLRIGLSLLLCLASTSIYAESTIDAPSSPELPVTKVPSVDWAAESYFSGDSQRLIFNAKFPPDEVVHTYTVKLNGSELTKINELGEDACSFFFPSGDRVIFTSTRDNLNMPAGDWSDSTKYPQGAELYTAALDGSKYQRLTSNQSYDAEVSISPDGRWILFTRQVDGHLDLWRMRADGTNEQPITKRDDWQKGGAFYLPDSHTIVYRAWKFADEGKRGKAMDIFLISDDGSDVRRLTDDGGFNWSPYPAPDGKHLVFVKRLPPHNLEIYLLDIESKVQRQLTWFDGFDGFPSISPDGKSLSFSSSRAAAAGERKFSLFVMDVSSLHLGADGR